MPKKVAKKKVEESVVLVGPYRADQMKKWILPKGYYNYPVGEAMHELGGRCLFASEWDKDAQRTYAENNMNTWRVCA